MKIPEKVKTLFNKIDLVAFATSDKNDNPNVVPIFWKIIKDDSIILIDNFMKMTKQNLLENNKVCISFWDPNTEEAYKLKGTAIYHVSGKIFDDGIKFVKSKKPERNPKGVVEIKITEIFNIKCGEEAGNKLEG